MDEKNTVTVVIYGQEYTISGDMPRDYILKLADHFDSKMKEVGSSCPEAYSKLAVLAGMMVSDEFFDRDSKAKQLAAENAKLSNDAKNYEKMWGELKQSFAQYKAETESLSSVKENIQRFANEQEALAGSLSQELAQEKKYNNELRKRVEELLEEKKANENIPIEAKKHIDELENKCRDIESSFFDIQMENIHLKNEIETLRGRK